MCSILYITEQLKPYERMHRCHVNVRRLCSVYYELSEETLYT